MPSSESVLLDGSDGGVCGIIIPGSLRLGRLRRGEHVKVTKKTVMSICDEDSRGLWVKKHDQIICLYRKMRKL